MSYFYDAWNALYGDSEPREQESRAKKVFNRLVTEGADFRNFAAYIRALPNKNARTIEGLATAYASDHRKHQEPSEEPREPPRREAPPPVSAPKTTPAPTVNATPKVATTRFVEIWRAWPPNNAFPEREGTARAAYEVACSSYGEQVVVDYAKKYIRAAKNLDTPKHFKTWAEKDLPIWMEQRKKAQPPSETPEEAEKLRQAYWDWVNRF